MMRARITVLAYLMALALVPAAHAADDAGTRSVFAEGAGSRPLAMGGAFAAVADDATATMWNAGGLGLVSRFEIQASQTHFFDAGVTESYLSIVKPDWRWGTASFTLRHFGVGGVDQRDERNTVLAENLSDSQTEATLGYGRPWGEMWTFGLAVKARRQSLAGFSATGLGMDVGMTGHPGMLLGGRFPWLRDLTTGLSLTNLLRPSMRLVNESVADPSAVRVGFGYTHDLPGMRTLLATLDIEKAGDVGAHLHAGAELRVHPMLALRAGLRSTGLTAGTGIAWHDFRMDYAFENNPLGDVQRVGLSYSFGATVSESRAAAQRAEEAALAERMDDAFQKRQADQVASLLSQAEALVADGRSDEALEALATASALDPDRADIRTQMVTLLRERGQQTEAAGDFAKALVSYGRALELVPGDSLSVQGQRRCQEASDQRAARSVDVRRQFVDAMTAFAGDDLIGARRGFEEVVQTDPNDEDARMMLQRTRQAIDRRVAALLEQADGATRREEFSEAGEMLAQVRGLDPTSPRLAPAEAALTRAREHKARVSAEAAALARPAGPPPVVASLSTRRLRELDVIYRRGLDAMQQQKSDEALHDWELVWSEAHDFEQVADHLKREYLTRGMEAFAAGRLQDAVSFWEKALQVDPKDQRARGYLDRALKQLERTRAILGTQP
jgi:tetratricopeptide (TPR) repeat protein